MKRLAFVLGLAAAACGRGASTAPSTGSGTGAAPAGQGSVVEASFHAPSLGVDKRYVVYLPAGYADAPARRYPVVYMLHGLGGNERDWTGGGKLHEAADALGLQVIVVMPDGDSSFYVDWLATPPCTGNPFGDGEPAASYCVTTAAYDAYVTRDLIGHVDATYRTIAERPARGIGGLSMGGFGALQLAMRHRDQFAAAASHSGVDSLFYAGPVPYEAGKVVVLDDVGAWGKGAEPIGGFVRGILGPDRARWEAHDPVTLAQALAPGDLALYLDCGTEDGFGLQHGAQYLHDTLRARGIEHVWYLGPGRHDFRFWGERIDDSLGFFARALAPAR